MTSDENKIIESAVGECQVKLGLITDYLERFHITDPRITAPLFDVERCIGVIMHVIYDHDSGNTEFSNNREIRK